MVELGARHPHDTAHRAVIVALECGTADGAVAVCRELGIGGRFEPVAGEVDDPVATVVHSADTEALAVAVRRGADVAMAWAVPSTDLLRACAQHGAGLWIRVAPDVHREVERARAAGVPVQRIIVDAALLVDAGPVAGGTGLRMATSIAVEPDPGAHPGPGALEAETVAAVHHGARVLLTPEVRRVRRCADVAVLLASVADDPGARSTGTGGARR